MPSRWRVFASSCHRPRCVADIGFRGLGCRVQGALVQCTGATSFEVGERKKERERERAESWLACICTFHGDTYRYR